MVIPLLASQDLTPVLVVLSMIYVKDEGSIQEVGPLSFVHDQCVCQCTLVSLKAGPSHILISGEFSFPFVAY